MNFFFGELLGTICQEVIGCFAHNASNNAKGDQSVGLREVMSVGIVSLSVGIIVVIVQEEALREFQFFISISRLCIMNFMST